METENSQAKRLLETLSRFKRTTNKSYLDDVLPQRDYMVLHIISHHKQKSSDDPSAPPGIKVSELSEILRITSPSVSQMINALEEKQYVERITTKNDRRVVYIALTKQGQAVLEEANKAFVTLTNEIISELGVDQTEQLIRLIDQLQNAMIRVHDKRSK